MQSGFQKVKSILYIMKFGLVLKLLKEMKKKNGLYNLRKEIMEALKNPHKLKNLSSEDDDMIFLPEDIPKKR